MCCLFIVCLHGNTFDHNNPIRGKVHIQSFNTLASDAYQMFSRLFSHRVKASFDCHLLLTETSRAAFEVDIFLQCTAHFLVIHKVWIFSCAVRCKQSLLMDPCHRKRTCFTFVFSKHIFWCGVCFIAALQRGWTSPLRVLVKCVWTPADWLPLCLPFEVLNFGCHGVLQYCGWHPALPFWWFSPK